MKRIVARNRKTGECKTFKHVLDTICKCDGLTGEEKSLTLVISTTDLTLDLKLWDILLESGEPEDLCDPNHIDSFSEFNILARLAHSLKDADLYYLADLLCYDLDQLHDDIDFFVSYSDFPISSDN